MTSTITVSHEIIEALQELLVWSTLDLLKPQSQLLHLHLHCRRCIFARFLELFFARLGKRFQTLSIPQNPDEV